MRVIELTRGQVAIVDDEDFQNLAQYKWMFNGNYAIRRVKVDGKLKTVFMHRVIANPPSGFEADHINLNKLDNRRSNLRTATRTQNMWNRPPKKNNKLGIKGVSYHKWRNRYQATVSANGKLKHLGYFDSAEEAKAMYDKEAAALHGEFVRLN